MKIDEDEAVDSKDALERSRSSPTVMTKLGNEVPGIFFAQKVGDKLKPAPNMMHMHLKDQLSHQSLHHYPHLGPTKLVPDSPSNKRRKLSNKETAPDTLGTEESVHSGSVGSKHFDMNSLITMFQANQPNEKSGSLRTCLDFPWLDVYVVKVDRLDHTGRESHRQTPQSSGGRVLRRMANKAAWRQLLQLNQGCCSPTGYSLDLCHH